MSCLTAAMQQATHGLCHDACTKSSSHSVAHACRILKPGGKFVVITYGSPKTRMHCFTAPDLHWNPALYTITKPSTDNSSTSAEVEPVVQGPFEPEVGVAYRPKLPQYVDRTPVDYLCIKQAAEQAHHGSTYRIAVCIAQHSSNQACERMTGHGVLICTTQQIAQVLCKTTVVALACRRLWRCQTLSVTTCTMCMCVRSTVLQHRIPWSILDSLGDPVQACAITVIE